MGDVADQLAAHVFRLRQLFRHLVEAERQLGQLVQVASPRVARDLHALVVMPGGNMLAGRHHRLHRGDHLAGDEYAGHNRREGGRQRRPQQ